MFIPEIYAKGSLTREQLSVKQRIGCDGLEVQLLGEMIRDRELGLYAPAEDVYDLSILSEYESRVIHAPIVPGMGDVTLERMADDKDGFLLEQLFYIAETASKYHGQNTIIVVHSEDFYDRLSDIGDTWDRIVGILSKLLQKYPHTEVAIENVSPLRGIGKGKELHLANNFAFDNVIMAEKLCEQLNTDRIGVCLDTCHQMLSEKYITGLYQMVADVPVPDLSMTNYFDKYKKMLKLIHLCDIIGSGYGKGRHGVPFHQGTYNRLRNIMDLYYYHNCTCPITLEVEETDFSTSSGYRNTKEQLNLYFESRRRQEDSGKTRLLEAVEMMK